MCLVISEEPVMFCLRRAVFCHFQCHKTWVVVGHITKWHNTPISSQNLAMYVTQASPIGHVTQAGAHPTWLESHIWHLERLDSFFDSNVVCDCWRLILVSNVSCTWDWKRGAQSKITYTRLLGSIFNALPNWVKPLSHHIYSHVVQSPYGHGGKKYLTEVRGVP